MLASVPSPQTPANDQRPARRGRRRASAWFLKERPTGGKRFGEDLSRYLCIAYPRAFKRDHLFATYFHSSGAPPASASRIGSNASYVLRSMIKGRGRETEP